MYHIFVENLSKDYRIYDRPIDRLIEAITRRPRNKLFKALTDVSFVIEPNHSLGIIGDNGAGKSTLLKILAGTLTPSEGRVTVTGRVAALLELGAGFHPEFTGRQNISLTCSLLGIPADEIEGREPEIIDFSGLGEFIDRPVKTYSSGMYVRLGFAIATSVDPDILIIDEALAVGDLRFQKKCIDRMSRFKERGKTMLFCSHSMYHIQEICDSVLWLDHGTLQRRGPTDAVVAEYEDYCRAKAASYRSKAHDESVFFQTSDEVAKDCNILSVSMETPEGEPVAELTPFMDLVVRLEVQVNVDDVWPQFGVAFLMSDETIFTASLTHRDGIKCGPYCADQKVTVRLHIHELPIKSGSYKLLGGIADQNGLLWYDIQQIWPVTVRRGDEGIGLVTYRRTWSIDAEAAA